MLQEDLFYETSDKDSAASGLERVTFEQLPAATRTQTRRQKHARFNTTAHYTKVKQRHDETQIGLLEAHSEEDGAVFKVCRICMLRVFIIIIIKVHVCAVCIHMIVYSYCISNICKTCIVIGSRVAQCKGPHFQIYSYILYIYKAKMFVPISVHACAMLRLRPASAREGMEHSRGDWPQQVMHVHHSILYTVHDTENLTFSEEFRGCSARNDADFPHGCRGTSARADADLPCRRARIFRADSV